MRIYRKNSFGYYVYPVYNYLSFWFGVALAVVIGVSFILNLTYIQILADVRALAFVVAVATGLIEVNRSCKGC